jgi:phosphate starvation-inducible PhoH-like protein
LIIFCLKKGKIFIKNWRDTLFFGLGPTLLEEQRIYLDAIFNKQIVLVNAPSGTGKTTLAVGAAKVLEKPLVYTFSPVEEKKLGFRPGGTAKKEADYLRPLRSALYRINEDPDQAIVDPDSLDKYSNRRAWVHAYSDTFVRGDNIEDSTVILDEAQNWTPNQFKKMLTRIHDSCKVIVIGHVGQIDLPDPTQSGFSLLIDHFSTESYAAICTLTHNFRGQLAQHADKLPTHAQLRSR